MDKKKTCKSHNASSNINIFRDMQISETQKHTNSLQRNSKK